MTRFHPSWLAAGALSLSLVGCVTVLPKTKPAQLYTLGHSVSPPAPREVTIGTPIIVLQAPTRFVAAAEGDRILVSHGQKAAYIAQARWLSPVAELFDAAEFRAFESAGQTRLVAAGQVRGAIPSLRLDVRTFEARYGASDAGAPTVTIEASAELTDLPNHRPGVVKNFQSVKLATADRVGAIVDAFDAATTDVLGQIVTWTGANAP